MRGVLWALLAGALFASPLRAARVSADLRAPLQKGLQNAARAERARVRELRRQLAGLPAELLSRSLAHVPCGLQVAWGSALWSATGPPVRLRHRGEPLREIRLCPRGERFVALTSEGAVVIGEAVSGRVRHELTHKSRAAGVRWFPRGEKVLTWYREHCNCVVVCDAASGQGLHFFNPGNMIWDVAVLADGDSMAISTHDGRIMLCHADAGGPGSRAQVIFGAGGHIHACPTADVLLVCHFDGAIGIVNLTEGVIIRRVLGPRPPISPVRMAAINSRGTIMAALIGSRVHMWYIVGDAVSRSALLHDGMQQVCGLEFFPQGNDLLIFGDTGAFVWNTLHPWGMWRPISRGPVFAAVLSADGKLVATCNGRTATVSDVATGKALRRLPLPPLSGPPCGIDMGPDPRAFAGWLSDADQWASR